MVACVHYFRLQERDFTDTFFTTSIGISMRSRLRLTNIATVSFSGTESFYSISANCVLTFHQEFDDYL